MYSNMNINIFIKNGLGKKEQVEIIQLFNY